MIWLLRALYENKKKLDTTELIGEKFQGTKEMVKFINNEI